MQPGLSGGAEIVVSERDCATALGSGSLPVLATPRVVALMEQAACAAVESALAPGQTSVGVRIDVEHLAATPVGMRVKARAVLERVEGRTLDFAVSAEDEKEPIARGTHRRVLVDAERFLKKAEGKR
jgi:predicted thioesterase